MLCRACGTENGTAIGTLALDMAPACSWLDCQKLVVGASRKLWLLHHLMQQNWHRSLTLAMISGFRCVHSTVWSTYALPVKRPECAAAAAGIKACNTKTAKAFRSAAAAILLRVQELHINHPFGELQQTSPLKVQANQRVIQET